MTNNVATFDGQHNAGLSIGQNYGPLNIGGIGSLTDSALDARALQETKQRCHQLFRLVEGDGSEGYERYKEDTPQRAEGTCQWFLRHANYRSWKERRSGLLLVTADPGCGKSVLMKHLIDHEIEGQICYFFFKDQGQNSLKQALCALLHQLFSHQFCLIEHALPYYRSNGSKLTDLTDALWGIFCKAIRDPRAGSITIAVDALDECRTPDLKRFINLITNIFPNNETAFGEARLILSSRPYEDVVSEFWMLAEIAPSIRISGEEHSHEISQEVDIVIRSRVLRLCKKWKMRDDLKAYLEKKLLGISHRTYLWVVLVFDHLDQLISKTKKNIGHIIDNIPESVVEAYEKILNRCKDQTTLRKILSILLAAMRPLKVLEMQIALNVETEDRPQSVFEYENSDSFGATLREYCGLFIVIQNETVYFLHQTAREFLLHSTSTLFEPHSAWNWFGSISSEQAHSLLTKICITFLKFDHFSEVRDAVDVRYIPFPDFYYYANPYWTYHFRHALPEDRVRLATDAADICSKICATKPNNSEYSFLWSVVLAEWPRPHTRLNLACYYGLCEVITKHLTFDDLELRSEDGKTALHHSAEWGKADVVRALLVIGADVNAEDFDGETALFKAKDADTVRMLTTWNANPDVHKKSNGRTALHQFCVSGSADAVRAVLDRGPMNVNAQDHRGETALHFADRWKRTDLVPMLLERGADFTVRDQNGKMPFGLGLRSDTDVITDQLHRLSRRSGTQPHDP